MEEWMEQKKSVILSSRIRLARNYKDYPFPDRLNEKGCEEIVEQVGRTLNGFRKIVVGEVDDTTRYLLVERHLASRELMDNPCGALFFNEEETLAIMVGEEDHLRLQSLEPGLGLRTAYERIDGLDRKLEKVLPYAYDPQWGYLSACPTNVGTGMRASALVHLPALSMTGQMDNMARAVSKLGITVRGMYGEGSEPMGDLFQISNQLTLGRTEEELISRVQTTVESLAELELEGRRTLLEYGHLDLEDRLNRSYGLMLYAKKLELPEFMRLISDVLLGAEMELLPVRAVEPLQDLLVTMQPAGLAKTMGDEMSPAKINILRAKKVQEVLRELKEED